MEDHMFNIFACYSISQLFACVYVVWQNSE